MEGLTVVNSVWGERTYTWEQPFLDVLGGNGNGNGKSLIPRFPCALAVLLARASGVVPG